MSNLSNVVDLAPKFKWKDACSSQVLGNRARVVEQDNAQPPEWFVNAEPTEEELGLEPPVADDEPQRSGKCSGTKERKSAPEQGCSGVADDQGGGSKADTICPMIPKWPEPVEGAALLDELASVFKNHLVMSEGAAETAALWCVFAHAHDSFQHSPILAFLSPVYGCGKTTALGIVNALTRSKMFSHVTTASIFRFIDKHAGVGLIFDDGEGYIRADNRDMMSILDSGHHRSGASVLRCDGDAHEPKPFSTWTPKAIGKVGDLSASLTTRSIIINMKRKRADEPVSDFSPEDETKLRKELARKIARWVWDHRSELGRAQPKIPSCLFNRARDNWKPLLAIAEVAGGHWPQTARRVAILLSGEKEDPTEGVKLLADIRGVFDTDRISSQSLCTKLGNLEDRPWCEYHQKCAPITQNELAALLRPFDVKSRNVRINKSVAKGYERADFDDAFARYLGEPDTPTPEKPLHRYSAGNDRFSPPATRYTTRYVAPAAPLHVGGAL